MININDLAIMNTAIGMVFYHVKEFKFAYQYFKNNCIKDTMKFKVIISSNMAIINKKKVQDFKTEIIINSPL